MAESEIEIALGEIDLEAGQTLAKCFFGAF
jgi:hypothetical protein